MLEILILSLVQGVTEFIPVSSSSHLFIISEYIDFEEQSLHIDVSLHIGSFIAVISYFHKDIFNFLENKKLFIKILVASIPIMVSGYILVKTGWIEQLRNIKVIGWTTFAFGILLYISDRFRISKSIKNDFDFKSALLIGIFQILSLIPGVSRSGISLTGARMLNFKRFDAAKISFLLSIPTLGAVSIFGINNIISTEDQSFTSINYISIVLSFIFSLITIKFFLKFIEKFSLNLFVIYRIILGFILLIIGYL